MKTTIKKLIILLALVFSIIAGSLHVFAEEDDGTEIIHARFYTLTTQKNGEMEVAFNRNWFKEDSHVYQHDLAKLSLGLATAAFRPNIAHSDGITSADMNLNDFLTEAHFKDLRSDDYDKDPNMYTVSTVMGHQRIGEGDESFELVAVGLCGQGYLDEWESNFSIGDGVLHDGFSRSSQLVYDRIFGYIASQHLEGPYKIWLSGFSRAAAVSNITAARLDDSNLFDEDSVFCYTFATPRTTRKKEEGRYTNIFNIVGKDDPVPCIPFADWGFERYGVDLLTPALETDSDFETKRIKADEVYKTITGIDYWTNHDADAMSRTLLSYLLKICPSASVYKQSLQEKIIRLWEDRNPLSILSNILDIANDPLLINEETETEANGLLDYLSIMLMDAIDEDNMFRRWNENASVGANMLQAHTPELYISWVFSADERKGLYTGHDTYRKVYISDCSSVNLLRSNEVIETITSSEKENFDKDSHIYFGFTDEKVSVLIPGDEEYTLYIEPDENGSISFCTLDYRIGRQSADHTILYGFDVGDEDLEVTFTRNGKIRYSSEQTFSQNQVAIHEAQFDLPSTVRYIRNKASSISWRDLTLISLFIPMLLIALIMFQLTFVIGRIRFSLVLRRGWLPKGTKYRAFPYLCFSAVIMFFINMELYRALFPEQISGILAYKRIIAITLCAMALYGILKQKNRQAFMIFVCVFLLCWADLATSQSMVVGPVLHIISCLLLSGAFMLEETPSTRQIILWIVLSLIGLFILNGVKGEYGILKVIGMVYVVAGLMMVCASINMPRRTFTGAFLLFISGILLIRNEINGTTFLNHIVSLGTFYIGVASVAGTGTQTRLPRLVPYVEPEKPEENEAKAEVE